MWRLFDIPTTFLSPVIIVDIYIKFGVIKSSYKAIGRWQGKPLEERLWLVCNRGIVEEEFHVLCECQTYSALLEDLFKSINEFWPGFEDVELREKLIYILKHENMKLEKFLIKACDSRRNLLYENA